MKSVCSCGRCLAAVNRAAAAILSASSDSLHLQILGVARDASDPDINRAYRKLARVYHPDMATGA